MNGITDPRYEFRVWGRRLDEIAARIRGRSDQHSVRISTEVYFVADAVDDVNPKLRDGVLDVKVLVDVARRCEQWVPWLKTVLPVSRETIAEQLFPRLGMTAPFLSRTEYGPAELVEEVVEPHPDLLSVEVSKRREAYVINGVTAEVADVVVAGRQLQTVAFESVDLDALCDAVQQVRLEGFENLSYPRAVKSTLAGAYDEGEG